MPQPPKTPNVPWESGNLALLSSGSMLASSSSGMLTWHPRGARSSAPSPSHKKKETTRSEHYQFRCTDRKLVGVQRTWSTLWLPTPAPALSRTASRGSEVRASALTSAHPVSLTPGRLIQPFSQQAWLSFSEEPSSRTANFASSCYKSSVRNGACPLGAYISAGREGKAHKQVIIEPTSLDLE